VIGILHGVAREKTKEGKRFYTEDTESTEGTEKKKWRTNLA
jgi:hypothetical protein